MPTRLVGLLAIAAAYEGQDRAAAAKIGAMDRQTLRDWVHRFNAAGPEGLIDRKPAGAARRLTAEQEAELAALIEAGPDVRARRGGALALCRPAAADPDPLEYRLSRAHDRQVAAAARVPAHCGFR